MLLRIGEQPTLLTEIGAKADTEFSPEMNIFCHHMALKIQSNTLNYNNTTKYNTGYRNKYILPLLQSNKTKYNQIQSQYIKIQPNTILGIEMNVIGITTIK